MLKNICLLRLQSIQDPDPLIACELMDTRDDFFTFARERYFEFSSLRRAKYSTMWMLFELHNKEEEMYEYEYTCNNCEAHVKTRYSPVYFKLKKIFSLDIS